jgi:outer membrane protein OmpA-like peptidoglycan-associated protein
MKTRMFAVLFLCMALALPVFAQQSSSSSSTQPAASASSSGQTATGKEPLTYKPSDFWDGDQPSGFWLIFHPFASKAYVRRNTQAIQDRVNELNELTESSAKQIKDVDARAQQGIQLASAKADEADQHAADASNKAQMAQQTATTVDGRATTVATVVGGLDQYKPENRTVIRFRPGQSALSKQAKEALDQTAMQAKDQKGYVIEVQGFAAGSGQSAIAASRKMADAVQRYLVLNHDIPPYRIYVLAMGNAPVASEEGTTDKHVSRNRVEVGFLKNDLGELATATPQTK